MLSASPIKLLHHSAFPGLDIPPGNPILTFVQPKDIQHIGQELAIQWSDGRESFIPLETLRRFCPCAGCMGEKDIFGTVYRAPDRPYSARAFELVRCVPVGSYAIQPQWGDGHASGIYTWDWLHRVAHAPSE
jgi:DUF971 family protein